jgi:hypothetical protein
MYILVVFDEIRGLGLTPEEAYQDCSRRFRAAGILTDDSPPEALYPCSAELYRLCEAKPRDRFVGSIPFRIEKGVAIPSTKDKQFLGTGFQDKFPTISSRLPPKKKKKRKRRHRPG